MQHLHQILPIKILAVKIMEHLHQMSVSILWENCQHLRKFYVFYLQLLKSATITYNLTYFIENVKKSGTFTLNLFI